MAEDLRQHMERATSSHDSTEEELEHAQAEIERLKAEWHRLSLDYLELEQKGEQLQIENNRLKAAAVEAHAELDKVERYFLNKAKDQSVSKEEALLRSIFSEPYMALVKAQAALAEGDDDGELKPEVEARLRESLKTPREELLTPEQMRQKLEGDGDDPDR